ncbi:MAG TPA: YceI family protein [Candidatus Acidoferrales bacterium]|nr:YceI family protein [Candidatus Acidoferrales bacterium]
MTRLALRIFAVSGFVLAACGSAATAPTASPTVAPTATTSATATTTTAAAFAWTISSDTKATVSVREQLARVNLPSDAVLTAKNASGGFSVNADGTFSADSKITIDMTTLASDQRERDNFIKQDTLSVRQFPTATFVPTKATGLSVPIPNGDLKFTLAGKMTIHGTTKDVTFDVVGRRDGAKLTVTATANPTWKFGDFGMRPPASNFNVLSVVDEIRLVVDIVATGPANG